jgi:uncharacterized protein (UPF0179 family)
MSGVNKNRRTIITLVGIGQAKVGESFIYRGPSLKCGECKYFNVCAKNLERGRIYRIVNLRDKVLACEMHNLEMRVVEVVEAEIEAAVTPKQAIEGVVFSFHPQECTEEGCENIKLCLPENLKNNDRCMIIKVYGSIRCPRGLQLMRVLLVRVPPSF